MGVFRQLGDPVCPDCLCQHHGAAYQQFDPEDYQHPINVLYNNINDATAITSRAITITERCCVVVNAATATYYWVPPAGLKIERPLATDRTMQTGHIDATDLELMHHATWEVLDPGTYTYFLVNRSGGILKVYGAWLKIVASDCEA